LSAPVSVSYNDVVKLSQDIATKSWHTKWNQDTTGFYTRHLIPEVGTKVTFPEKGDVGISYCHLLLHDTLLRDDAHRTGISDTPVCERGVERQSADHFLFHCNRHQDARIKLKYVVTNIMDLSACQSRIHLSESLLLALRCNDVTRKQNILIKVSSLPVYLRHTVEALVCHTRTDDTSVHYFQLGSLCSSTCRQNFTVKSNICYFVSPEDFYG